MTQLRGPAPVPLTSLETPALRVSWMGPMSARSTAQGHLQGLAWGSGVKGLLLPWPSSAYPWGPSCQYREVLSPRLPPVSLHLLSTECPFGWHGPGCQQPCEYKHQCPCNSQTGNISLSPPALNSILSQGRYGPSQILWGRRGQTPPSKPLSHSLVPYSEAVSAAIRGHPEVRRALPPHWVGALVGPGRGGSNPLPSTFEAWPLCQGLGKARRCHLDVHGTFLHVSRGRVTADAAATEPSRGMVWRDPGPCPWGSVGAGCRRSFSGHQAHNFVPLLLVQNN